MKTESMLSKIARWILLLLSICASVFIVKYGWNAVIVPFSAEIGFSVEKIGLGLAFVFMVIYSWLTSGFRKGLNKSGWSLVEYKYAEAGFELLLLYIATLFL